RRLRPMPNARPKPELRLTPEKREQLRRLTEAVENGTAPVITHEADLAARAFREIERLRRIESAAKRVRDTHPYDHKRVARLCDCSLCELNAALDGEKG